ncbi:MAG: 4-hydroxythreonine-4-phosphate dehydrogenase PdxA [Acetobacteraceae bacterium]
MTPRVAIALGDPAGIGPELALKAATDPRVRALCTPVLFGAAAAVAAHRAAAGCTAPVVPVARADRPVPPGAVALVETGPAAPPRLGVIAAEHGRAALDAAGAAIDAARAGLVAGVVACPQTEAAIHQAGIDFDGYPSFVARRTGIAPEDAFLMLCFDATRIVHATLHVSLARAIALITPERLARGLAHVPEGRQVFAGLTVGENLRLGAYGQRHRLGAGGMTRRISEVCARFLVLAERFDTPAGNLSGGQQQLLAIGRALMAGPRVLVLDEPSLGLAPLMVAEIFQLIRGLRDAGLAILLAEQNARQSLAIADRGVVLERGTVVLEGSGAELLGRAEVAERYLGLGAAATGTTAPADLAPRLRALLQQEGNAP